ncbi:DUF6478 family protein [Thetidibacter halocola]|uniref:Uncharacterized protein n=1 Tax=Thetidibacter halocola TaxID=2827239 RepID=A0A8J7WIG8_9RHOB|nr:DUF6478 family protein [Thetidibacter halocola]MBS0125698.1 hypothetical protein [Thetidibacter halocola]
MTIERQGWLDRTVDLAALRRWRRRARLAWKADPMALRDQRNRARLLRAQLDQVIHVSDARLALPMIGTQAFPRPRGSDWAWRPELWCGPLAVPGLASVPSKSKLGAEVALFHDCPRAEIALRQLRNTAERDLAAYGMRLEVFRFDGSYLSLAVDMPEAAADGLGREHLVRVDTIVELEKKIEIFARLNIRHGPNTEQIVREVPVQDAEVFVEFDLAYTKLNEKRVERMWLDLIFESPQMNQIILRDLTFSRRKRAAF